MNLTRPLLLLCLATPCLARAQDISVYGTVALTDYGYATSGNSVGYKTDTYGFSAGSTYLFAIPSRFKAGLDARLAYSPGDRGGTAGALALHFAFVPDKVRARPYLQIGGGFISTTGQTTPTVYNGFSVYTNTSSQRYNGGGLALAFGLDVPVTAHVDWRAIDYGAEGGSKATHAYLGTGIRYHFSPARHKP